jgi:hypothetical protein
MQAEHLSAIKLDASSREAGAFKGAATANYCIQDTMSTGIKLKKANSYLHFL